MIDYYINIYGDSETQGLIVESEALKALREEFSISLERYVDKTGARSMFYQQHS